jgi:hypothetical protein
MPPTVAVADPDVAAGSLQLRGVNPGAGNPFEPGASAAASAWSARKRRPCEPAQPKLC